MISVVKDMIKCVLRIGVCLGLVRLHGAGLACIIWFLAPIGPQGAYNELHKEAHMARTIISLFNSIDDANHAVQDLINNGVPREDISLIVSDRRGEWTSADAARTGATAGTALGGGIGLLAGLGALAISGIGSALAAGPLAAALGLGVAGAAAGAAAGGLIGALTKAGVSEDHAHVYAESVQRGGALVAVLIPLIARIVSVDLRVGLRSMLAARGRAVTTMLALTVGSLMLSLVLLLVNTLVRGMENAAADTLGGTAQITLPYRVSVEELAQALQNGDVPGYRSHFKTASYNVTLQRIETAEGTFALDELRAQREQTLGAGALTNLGMSFSNITSNELTPRLAATPPRRSSNSKISRHRRAVSVSTRQLPSGIRYRDEGCIWVRRMLSRCASDSSRIALY